MFVPDEVTALVAPFCHYAQSGRVKIINWLKFETFDKKPLVKQSISCNNIIVGDSNLAILVVMNKPYCAMSHLPATP